LGRFIRRYYFLGGWIIGSTHKGHVKSDNDSGFNPIMTEFVVLWIAVSVILWLDQRIHPQEKSWIIGSTHKGHVKSDNDGGFESDNDGESLYVDATLSSYSDLIGVSIPKRRENEF